MKIKEKAIEILKLGYVCDHCLGRQFSQLLSGFTNEERGKFIRNLIAMEMDSGEQISVDLSNFYGIKFLNKKIKPEKPKECIICKDFFKEKIGKIAERVVEKIKKYEFDTFLVGSILSDELSKAEEELWKKVGVEFCETIKSEINRELGKIVKRKIKKKFETKNPDITVIVDLKENRIKAEVRSLYILGEYKKIARGIPQTKWTCKYCRGKGCKYCNWKGKMYPTSVQEIIEKPFLKVTKGKKSKFHGCVAPFTNILLTESSLQVKELENNWKNYEILTYDISKGKIVPSRLADFMKLNTKIGLKTFEITTKETGRKIVATEDHQFLTPLGMLSLKRIKVGQKLAVYPIDTFKPDRSENRVILSEKDILDVINRYVPNSNKRKIIRELKERKLLPLTTKDKKILIISRLLGFLFGDGTVRLYRKRDVGLGFYGEKEDLKEIKADLKKIGFNSNLFKKEPRTSTLRDYYGNVKRIKSKNITYKLICYSKSLWILLVALGAPIGDKVIKEFEIPKWIKKSGKSIKKEFLASLLGTEIDKPRLDNRKYNRKSFNSPRFSMNKSEKLLKNGLKFIEDLRKLLKEFNVKTLKPRIIPYTTRKDGHKSLKIYLDISNKFENLINLYGKIGFRYAKKKDILGRYAYEYLLMKKRVVDERKKIYKKAIEMRKKGFTPMQIFKKLNYCKFVNYKNLAMWLSPKNHIFNCIKVPNDFPNFDEWIAKSTKNLKDGLVWETVESIREVKVPFVYDLTTKKQTHTFFANGFLVSNSGREDIDARCLDYRPFVIEIVRPIRRKISLKEMEKEVNKSKKVKVRRLRFASKETIRRVKTARIDKTYFAEVWFENDIDKKKLKGLKNLVNAQILQKTPLRVLHRRANKIRKRKVKEVSWKVVGKKKLELKIKAESGLYIKELITGDEGRTKPSISEILNNKVKKINLDVIKIHKKGERFG